MNAPGKTSQKQLLDAVALKLNKKSIQVHIPPSIINLFAGGKAKFLINGLNLSNEKIINAGYEFKYPDIKSALEDLV